MLAEYLVIMHLSISHRFENTSEYMKDCAISFPLVLTTVEGLIEYSSTYDFVVVVSSLSQQ